MRASDGQHPAKYMFNEGYVCLFVFFSCLISVYLINL